LSTFAIDIDLFSLSADSSTTSTQHVWPWAGILTCWPDDF